MPSIPYHHPSDKQFSLSYVNEDESNAREHIGDQDEVEVKVEEYEVEKEFYAVYTNTGGGEPIENIVYDGKFHDDNNRVIVSRIMEALQRIVETQKEEENSPVVTYKEGELGNLSTALDRTEWSGIATDVAGELASNLVLTHALPNANHRTAVSTVQLYLKQIDSDFSMPQTVDTSTYDWRDWVDQHISKSKAIATVRRKNVLLKLLQEYGVTKVERRNGVVIDLDDYDLDMPPGEAQERYAEVHQNCWINFVEQAVERADKPELKESDALSKREFADELRR